jgi:hypothetical protein
MSKDKIKLYGMPTEVIDFSTVGGQKHIYLSYRENHFEAISELFLAMRKHEDDKNYPLTSEDVSEVIRKMDVVFSAEGGLVKHLLRGVRESLDDSSGSQ